MKRTLAAFFVAATLAAQVPLNPPQLQELVSRIALYPDPLLAQVLSAATYSNQLPDAASWADQHSYLTGQDLARAISQDNLPWDPSVIALLPFPSVLDQLAANPAWARQLGDAVLSQRADVMDAVQAMRQKAANFGYLQSWPQYRIVNDTPGYIQILPMDPAYYYVPVYDPLIVFRRPRASVSVGINFGPRIFLGVTFNQWGWGHSGLGWSNHTVILDGRPWLRSRDNYRIYRHPYSAPYRPPGPRAEHHELRPPPGRHEPPRREAGRGERK